MVNRIRYLTAVLVLLSSSISLWAQDDTFNPASPAEPGPPGDDIPMLSLLADPVEGGTVSGAGWYSVGSKVTLRAYNKSNYVFERWANEAGETVSTESQFKYTKLTDDETLTAYFRFSPGSPADPVEIAKLIYHQLTVKAEEGGSVSGGGKYLPDTRVYLSASVSSGYVFGGWYDENGTLVSSTQNFYYTTQARPVTLIARFRFIPGSPGEPAMPDMLLMHKLTVYAEEGGTVNIGESKMKEGATTTLTATANTGYVFSGWYKGDELYNANRSFTFKMGAEDIVLTACFTFAPSSPGEPSKPTTKKYAFYLLNKVTKPGTTVDYPIYLTSLDGLSDMNFQLTFPKELKPDLASVGLSAKADGYTVSCEALNDTVYAFSLTGGTLPEGNTSLLVFSVPIPQNIATAQNYPVKINQVSVTEEDGNTITASTRNGRISVYKNGDSNGDNLVNVIDVTNTISTILGEPPSVFITEAADTNDQDGINVVDVTNIIDIILEGNGTNTQNAKTEPMVDPE